MALIGLARRKWGDPLAYEQGLLYVWQICRRGGWWFESKERGMLLVAQDSVGVGEHCAVVPLTSTLPGLMKEAVNCDAFREVQPVRLRHVKVELADQLATLKCLRRRSFDLEGHGARTLEEVSEDSYPQVLVALGDHWKAGERLSSLQIPVLPTGAGYGEFRHQLRRFLRQVEATNELRVTSLSAADESDIDFAVQRWMDSVRTRYGKDGRPRVADIESCFQVPVEAVLRGVREFLFCNGVGELVLIDGRARGGWAGAWISPRCFGVNVLFADTAIKGLSEFVMYRAALYALIAGYEFLNLGGSELATLYDFKKKMAPRSEGGLRRPLAEFDFVW